MADRTPALFPASDSPTEVRTPRERVYEWPLAAALIWIVWRDIGKANAEWAACSNAGELRWCAADVGKAACHPAQAESLLLEGLRSGDVRAYGQRAEDPDPVLILPHRWSVLFLENSIPQAPDGFYSVLVQAVDVKRLVKDEPGPISAFTPAGKDPGARKMGAPTKYAWAAAAGYVAGFIVNNDPSRAEVSKALKIWFESRNEQPDPSEVDKFVTEIFKAMQN